MHIQVLNSTRILTLGAVVALTIGLAGCGTSTGERATSGAGSVLPSARCRSHNRW